MGRPPAELAALGTVRSRSATLRGRSRSTSRGPSAPRRASLGAAVAGSPARPSIAPKPTAHALRPLSAEEKVALVALLPQTPLALAPPSALREHRHHVQAVMAAGFSPTSRSDAGPAAQFATLGQLMACLGFEGAGELHEAFVVARAAGLVATDEQQAAVWALLAYPHLMRSRLREAYELRRIDAPSFELLDRLLGHGLPALGGPQRGGQGSDPAMARGAAAILALQTLDDSSAREILASPALLMERNGKVTFLL